MPILSQAPIIYLVLRGKGTKLETNNQLIELNVKSRFSLKEANDLIQIISKVTYKHDTELKFLTEQIEKEVDPEISAQLKLQAQDAVDRWNKKIEKLGGRPTGIWYVDIDFGAGYYCWSYPERKVHYWHKYDEGFSSRKELIDPTRLN